jgi:regulator of sigma E protease
VLGVLVFIHEMGHYLAARWRGIHVDAFSIGFGRPILRGTDRRGTEWRLGWLPLGGYVKLHGQEVPEETDAATRASWRPGQTFHEKPVGDRAIVVAAGPVANYLLAALLFAGLYMTVGQPTGNAAVGAVVEGSAAERGGLRAGDEIIALDGDARGALRAGAAPRAAARRPAHRDQHRAGRGGAHADVTPDTREEGRRAPRACSASRAARCAWSASACRRPSPPACRKRWTSPGSPSRASPRCSPGSGARATSADRSASPRSRAKPRRSALAPLVSLMALLSVSLGMLNLFPIRSSTAATSFLCAEAIRGRPLPPKAQEYGYRAGFALLATLFVLVSWNDIVHGTIGRFVARLVG